MPDINEIRERFSSDSFATQAAGAVVDLAEPGNMFHGTQAHPLKR